VKVVDRNVTASQPRLIGQYRITGVLGRGGMGVVYVAEHVLLGRPAAVKVLQPKLAAQQDFVTRFFNEARTASAIEHPGIVEIYDFGWTPTGTAFIVMELLRGETLRARRERAPLPWTTALAFTRQIAGALGAAHAKGIIHRDLKPDNVFVVQDPEVPGGERIKILDFGLAKLAGSSPNQHLTRTGFVLGTPTYMAPEQCRGIAVDSRADLYALGCLLFELCAGRPPFLGEGAGDVMGAHMYMPPPTIASLARTVPPELEALVQRLLAKTPLDRVQTADEVIRLVDTVTARVGATTPTTGAAGAVVASFMGTTAVQLEDGYTTLSSAASTHALARPRPSRRRGLIVGAGVGAAALAGVIALVVTNGGDGPLAAAADSTALADSHATAEPAPPPPPPPPSQPSLPATVEIVIHSVPAGATVLRDGVVLGVTPYRGALPRSDRELELVLQLRGYGDWPLTVRPSAAIEESVTLVQAKASPAPPPPLAPPKPAPAPPAPPPPEPSQAHDRVLNPFD
jgi:serine/threonine-protein kinase